MKISKSLIITVLIGLVIYYVLPLSASTISQNDLNNYSMICVIFINSVYVITSGILLTKYDGYKWYYAFIIGLVFIPSVVIYYNLITMVYTLLYILEFMIGSSISMRYNN